MAEEVTIASLRKRILRDRGIRPPKHHYQSQFEQPVEWLPEEFQKTPIMKYIEMRYNVKLRIDIFIGSLAEVCQRYNWDVDRCTISRWRKYIRTFIVTPHRLRSKVELTKHRLV